MKGGITSGVVYPTAICELARQYQFKNIGGASAGAIAAVATAAAEYGRKRGKTDSFDQFGQLPSEFQKPNFLPGLFTPNGVTTPLFKIAIRILKANSIPGRIIAGILGILVGFWGSVLFGVIIGAGISWLFVTFGGFQLTSTPQWLSIIGLTAAWIIVIVVAITAFRAVSFSTRALVQNGFGLSNGLSCKASNGSPLTEWMYALFNKLSGLPLQQPLTFGDLWAADDSGLTDGSIRAINLQVVTTNLNHLSPYTIPFNDHLFYFDPNEWQKLFPRPVFEWIVAHSRMSELVVHSQAGAELKPLPENADLPVVVAARLSLSFPGLVGAVPMYAVDFSLKCNQDKNKTLLADKCWFSDGGICSNFPVHFFDSPIPKWPTFAINLREPHPDHPDPVWFPQEPGEGTLASVTRFNAAADSTSQLVSFVMSIINTMEDWRDNLQTRMPGYRNRIVHISLKPDEGGLNLTMPPDLILKLTKLGGEAGNLLRTSFRWSQHVWTRYRTSAACLEDYLKTFATGYDFSFSEDPRIHEWLAGTAAEKPPAYAWKSGDQERDATNRACEIAEVGHEAQKNAVFGDGAPRPEPQLRVQPRF
jgi:predicted acylesterase/phospholipase RssA